MVQKSEQKNDQDEIFTSSYRLKATYRGRLMDNGLSALSYGEGARVAIYTRVSSDMQIEGYSMDAQVGRCREYAKSKGWDIYKVYSDPGYSAKNLDRPALQMMLQDGANKRFDIILIHKLDRLSRNLVDMSTLVGKLNDWEIMLSSMSENFDFTVASGRFFFHMLVVFAQWYLENLSAESVKAKEQMFIEGRHNGMLPFGYRKDEKTRNPYIIPKEAELIRKCFELYLTGDYGDNKLADYLNAQGSRTRKGRLWSKDSVRFMMRNEFYYGMVAHRNKLRKGIQEPIISKETYMSCQRMRKIKARAGRCYTDGRQKNIYLLQRIAKCSACGEPLVIRNVVTGGYRYYREGTRNRGLICEMNEKVIRLEKADAMALKLMREIQLPPDWQDKVQELVKSEDETDELKRHRNSLMREMGRLKKLYQKGHISEKEFDRDYLSLDMEIKSIVIPKIENITQKAMMIESLQTYLDEANQAELKKIVMMLFSSIYFDMNEQKIVGFQPHADFFHLFRFVDLTQWKEEGGIFRRVEDK